MTKTTTGVSITGVLLVLGIVLAILTWPKLSLQTKFEGGQSDFTIYYPNTAKLTVSVWNRGGVISDWRMITPESCIFSIVTENITCTHEGFSGAVPCTTGICGLTKAQETGPIDVMSLKFNTPHPLNFTITLFAQSSFSFLSVASLNETYTCRLNKGDNSYNCSKI